MPTNPKIRTTTPTDAGHPGVTALERAQLEADVRATIVADLVLSGDWDLAGEHADRHYLPARQRLFEAKAAALAAADPAYRPIPGCGCNRCQVASQPGNDDTAAEVGGRDQ